MTHRHRWHGYEKLADVPEVEPDPDDTQAIAKYAVKLMRRALLDDGVIATAMMLFAVSVSRLLPDFGCRHEPSRLSGSARSRHRRQFHP